MTAILCLDSAGLAHYHKALCYLKIGRTTFIMDLIIIDDPLTPPRITNDGQRIGVRNRYELKCSFIFHPRVSNFHRCNCLLKLIRLYSNRQEESYVNLDLRDK